MEFGGESGKTVSAAAAQALRQAPFHTVAIEGALLVREGLMPLVHHGKCPGATVMEVTSWLFHLSMHVAAKKL